MHQHLWTKYQHRRYCVLCRKSLTALRLGKLLIVSLVSVILASILVLACPIQSGPGLSEDLVRMRLIVSGARYVSVARAIEYTDHVIEAASQHRLSPYLLLALLITESELNYKAKSKLGYRGLAQIPASMSHLSPGENVMEGGRILREKMAETKDLERAIGLYKGFGPIKNAHTRRTFRLARQIERL